jgi:hypothetical protein
MAAIRWVYLGLAIWGAIMPMRYFGPWIAENGLDLPALVALWKAHPAVTGLYWDLVVSAIVLSVWVIYEAATRGRWRGLWALPATWMIGVSLGFPLFLFLRSSPKD